MSLQIPCNCNYSVFPETTDNIFEVKYLLTINLNIDVSNKINIPIIIGSYRYNENDNNIEKIPFLPKYKI